MTGVVVALVVIALVGAAIAYARVAKHPEQAAGHDTPADTTSDRFYRTSDRPAGPDAEEGPGPL